MTVKSVSIEPPILGRTEGTSVFCCCTLNLDNIWNESLLVYYLVNVAYCSRPVGVEMKVSTVVGPSIIVFASLRKVEVVLICYSFVIIIHEPGKSKSSKVRMSCVEEIENIMVHLHSYFGVLD